MTGPKSHQSSSTSSISSSFQNHGYYDRSVRASSSRPSHVVSQNHQHGNTMPSSSRTISNPSNFTYQQPMTFSTSNSNFSNDQNQVSHSGAWRRSLTSKSNSSAWQNSNINISSFNGNTMPSSSRTMSNLSHFTYQQPITFSTSNSNVSNDQNQLSHSGAWLRSLTSKSNSSTWQNSNINISNDQQSLYLSGAWRKSFGSNLSTTSQYSNNFTSFNGVVDVAIISSNSTLQQQYLNNLSSFNGVVDVAIISSTSTSQQQYLNNLSSFNGIVDVAIISSTPTSQQPYLNNLSSFEEGVDDWIKSSTSQQYSNNTSSFEEGVDDLIKSTIRPTSEQYYDNDLQFRRGSQ